MVTGSAGGQAQLWDPRLLGNAEGVLVLSPFESGWAQQQLFAVQSLGLAKAGRRRIVCLVPGLRAARGVLVTPPFWAGVGRCWTCRSLGGVSDVFSWFSYCVWYPLCRNSHTFDPVWGKEGNQPLLQQWNRPNTVAGSRRPDFAVYCCKIQFTLILATLLACHPIQKGTTL